MSPPAVNGSTSCPAGVAHESTTRETHVSPDGKTKITTESTITICKDPAKNSEKAAKQNQSLRNLVGQPKPKVKVAEGTGNEKNLGILPIEVRGEALARRGSHATRGPKGTSNYRMMTAAELKATPKRSAGVPHRAAGTPKK